MKPSFTFCVVVLTAWSVCSEALPAQGATTTVPDAWIALGIGGATLGIAPEVSAWYARGRLALGARWSKTVIWGEGNGDEHELALLVGAPIRMRRSTLVAVAGITRAGGCVTHAEANSTCNPLGVEIAPAWGVDLGVPVTRHIGFHAAAFGVQGRKIRYSGLSAGLKLGSFRHK